MPLTSVIASQGCADYFAAMPAVILRLMTLIALVLMPLGMGAVSAGTIDHGAPVAGAEHCGDQGDQPDGNSSRHSVDCIACSMLVTAGIRVTEPAPASRSPAARPLTEDAAGLHPETATPPPKIS